MKPPTILVYGYPKRLNKSSDLFGHLLHPEEPKAKFRRAMKSGRVWAADNGAFSNFNREAFIEMLTLLEPGPKCQWVSAPDSVGDHTTTLTRFMFWAPQIRERGFPVAFVAQDGATIEEIPWNTIRCLFIGGTTEWKMSPASYKIAFEAKERGKLLHMGRVNSQLRYNLAASLGCDSVDGASFNQFSDLYFVRAQRWKYEMEAQPCLW